jgi:hypothetical protein
MVHTTHNHVTKQTDNSKRCWLCAGIFVAGVAGFVGVAHLLLVTIDKVASGNGLETYRTVWFVEFNYIGLLILFAFGFFALLVAGGMWAYEWWQWRDLERKYGGNKRNTQ